MKGFAEGLRRLISTFEEADTDLYAYAGPIDRAGYQKLCRSIPKKDRRSNALLVLCTRGGDPHAGYRIARALIHHYTSQNLHILVPGPCKSAGTLICVGAHQLIVADSGELGPLDVQLQKQDELFQLSSGLDIIRGLAYLQEQTLQTYASYVVAINDSGLSTKIASEIASKLVMGIFEPMFAQIDPSRLGEMNAALSIASDYGSRLQETAKSLKNGALHRLIHTYPAHGFVIDRKEARSLFERVERPSPLEEIIGSLVMQYLWRDGVGESKVENLSVWLKNRLAQEEEKEAAELASGSSVAQNKDAKAGTAAGVAETSDSVVQPASSPNGDQTGAEATTTEGGHDRAEQEDASRDSASSDGRPSESDGGHGAAT